MEYTPRQKLVFDMIEALGFDINTVMSLSVGPDYCEVVLRGDETGAEITHRLPMRNMEAPVE